MPDVICLSLTTTNKQEAIMIFYLASCLVVDKDITLPKDWALKRQFEKEGAQSLEVNVMSFDFIINFIKDLSSTKEKLESLKLRSSS